MNFSRRDLFRRSAGVAGGLLFADVLPIARASAGPAVETGDLDPEFIQARVDTVQGDTINARTPELARRVVRVSSTTEVWRGGPASLGDIRPGDFFYARGQLDEEGYLNATGLWANIVNLTGSLDLSRDHASGELQLADRRLYHVHFAPGAQIFVRDTPVDLDGLGRTAPVAQIVGSWDESTASIAITSCWA